ncbi:MAG: hypothetical protein JSU00_00695 [Acidobacteria bacterium]|nr:hypothetical protein [Acidobacteriota bacterium]
MPLPNLLDWVRRYGDRAQRLFADRSTLAGSPQPRLRDVVERLERLNSSTEQDFLAIGEKLAALDSAARLMTGEIEALTGFMSGGRAGQIGATFETILDRARQLESDIERGRGALVNVQTCGDSIHRTLSRLRELLSEVAAVGALTRIESARLGGASGFESVADEVKTLIDNIRQRVASILSASAKVGVDIRAALDRMTQVQQRQLSDLPALARGVMTSLRSFEERRNRAFQASGQMSIRSRAASEATSDVVSLIQFHDITRQQVEHVIEALNEAGAAASGSVFAIQAAQLRNADQQFQSSVSDIGEKLGAIEAILDEMVSTAKGLFSGAGQDEDGFFLEMERSLTLILERLGGCAEGETARLEVVRTLEGTVGGIRQAVARIDEVGLQMQRMALNTAIRATHIGAAADPLGVLADGIRRLAAECGSMVDHVGRDLGRMEAALEAARANVSGDQVHGFAEADVRQAIEDVHSESESALCRTKQVELVGARMCEEIRCLRGGLSVGRAFRETTSECVLQLDAAARALGETGRRDAESLDRAASRYTMRAEREVHGALAGASPASPFGNPARAPDPAPPPGGEDQFGDNVELF